MLHAAFHKLWQGLRRLWYFVMDTPSLSWDLEDKLVVCGKSIHTDSGMVS